MLRKKKEKYIDGMKLLRGYWLWSSLGANWILFSSKKINQKRISNFERRAIHTPKPNCCQPFSFTLFSLRPIWIWMAFMCQWLVRILRNPLSRGASSSPHTHSHIHSSSRIIVQVCTLHNSQMMKQFHSYSIYHDFIRVHHHASCSSVEQAHSTQAKWCWCIFLCTRKINT